MEERFVDSTDGKDDFSTGADVADGLVSPSVPDDSGHGRSDDNTSGTDSRAPEPEENQSLTDQLDEDFDEEDKRFIESNSAASKVNVGYILAVILAVIAVIVLIILVLTKLSGGDDETDQGMQPSGGKKPPNLTTILGGMDSSAPDYSSEASKENKSAIEQDNEYIEEILNSMPDDYQLPGKRISQSPENPENDKKTFNILKQEEPGTAPIRAKKEEQAEKENSQPVVTSAEPPSPSVAEKNEDKQTSGKLPSDNYEHEPVPQNHADDVLRKPDTRNSSSVRKIEGIAGLPGSVSYDYTNQSTSGAYPDPSQMSRDEYIRQMAAMQGNQAGAGTSVSSDIESNKNNFFSESANDAGTGTFLPKNSLWDGTIIKGELQTGINTDNPGVVIARVTENVYSSYDYTLLLIPQGTLLYATYNSSVSYGQDRIQIAWNLMIRPDGYRMELGNMNGVDSKGYSGVSGWKYNHIWEELKALGMVAVYSILNMEITQDISKQKNEFISNAMTDVYKSTQDIANGMVERALDIKPSITVSPGTEIKLITNRPLTIPAMEPYPVTGRYVRY